jgi:hypothetical protein
MALQSLRTLSLQCIGGAASQLGSVRRCPMFPFTFDQKIATGDKRQVIDAKF